MPQIMIQISKEIDLLVSKKAEQFGYTKADYIVKMIEDLMRVRK
jgi:hypothetical protein